MSTLSYKDKEWNKQKALGILMLFCGFVAVETTWLLWITNLPLHGHTTRPGAWLAYGIIHAIALTIAGAITIAES